PLLFVVAIVVLLLKWFENLGIAYEITEDRLILHKGILRKSIDEIELYRVKDVRIDFSIVNQLADIGTISIASSDETTRDAPL
ncbi:PH domain-containing protein, partial [Escherichia coli]|nr:PH domain-containing protein [Escherichia coli]